VDRPRIERAHRSGSHQLLELGDGLGHVRRGVGDARTSPFEVPAFVLLGPGLDVAQALVWTRASLRPTRARNGSHCRGPVAAILCVATN
jgi:hypothetical protein